ncbi:MAG: SDR family NAD(P)-dependent oxidoreductase [Microthrixaceae bacterium]
MQFVPNESWEETIEVNLTGVFHTVKAGIRNMIEQDEGGAVVITSSTAGLRGFFYGAPAYNAANTVWWGSCGHWLSSSRPTGSGSTRSTPRR